MVKKCVDRIVRTPKTQIIGREAIVMHSRAIKVNSTFNSCDKSQTLADTGYKFIDKRINRQVQNNNPIVTLVEYGYVIVAGLSPSVRTFTCPEHCFNIPRDINSTLNFLNIYQFALWYILRALQCLSIALIMLNHHRAKPEGCLHEPVS
jgi:hypothetical protein